MSCDPLLSDCLLLFKLTFGYLLFDRQENILFADPSRNPNNIRLVDFGLAKDFCADGKRRMLTGVVGTVTHVAPEVFDGPYSRYYKQHHAILAITGHHWPLATGHRWPAIIYDIP